MIRKLSSVYVLVLSGFVRRCCPMGDSQLILELLFLQRRGGNTVGKSILIVDVYNHPRKDSTTQGRK